jgi:cyclophilin family peptidyl-prolyl cis-trans isomerase
MRRVVITVLVSLGFASAIAPAAQAQTRTRVILSPVYDIDRKYKSMEGPQSTEKVYVWDGPETELLWIVGVRTEMVGPDGETPLPAELMCHVNLDYDAAAHRALFAWQKSVSTRILTLSQGQLSARFPDGFGLPLLSSEPLSLTTQVLNHNIENARLKVRHRVTVDFIRDRELAQPLQPLFNAGIYGMVSLAKAADLDALKPTSPVVHGEGGCLPGTRAPNAMSGSDHTDAQGTVWTGHWVVPPGRQVTRTDVTGLLGLPFDTTLHHAAVHLHPFAESLELLDAQSGQTLFRSQARGPAQGVGLVSVDSFSSREGIALRRDGKYELVAVYNNTSGAPQDSMAVLYLGLRDQEFRPPALPSTSTAAEGAGQPRVRMRTTAGDLVLELDPSAAPRTVEQLMALVRAGAYDGTRIATVLPGFVVQTGSAGDRAQPLSAEQRALARRLPLELSALRHEKGVLSMARAPDDREGAESSFCILLAAAPHLDGQYTTFGRVIAGWETIERIARVAAEPGAAKVEIRQAELLSGPRDGAVAAASQQE